MVGLTLQKDIWVSSDAMDIDLTWIHNLFIISLRSYRVCAGHVPMCFDQSDLNIQPRCVKSKEQNRSGQTDYTLNDPHQGGVTWPDTTKWIIFI